MTYDAQNYAGEEWLDALAYTDEWNIRALFALLAMLGPVKSFMDVGCGRGTLVRLMDNINDGEPGTLASGIELFNLTDDPFIEAHDLREPLPDANKTPLDCKYELVTSWEVGEHLPEESANVYCDTLVELTDRWLVFTAAHPGQGGDHHINEQPKSYWCEKLEARGLIHSTGWTHNLHNLWTTDICPNAEFVALTGPCSWLPQNVMVFERP